MRYNASFNQETSIGHVQAEVTLDYSPVELIVVDISGTVGVDGVYTELDPIAVKSLREFSEWQWDQYCGCLLETESQFSPGNQLGPEMEFYPDGSGLE